MNKPSPIGGVPSVTFLLCIEAGKFEAMTVLLVDSIRRFGGRFSGCPIVAVCPRPGPALTEETVVRLKEMNCRLVVRHKASKFPWNGFYNKPAAMQLMEHEFDTDFVCFLDGDTLVLRSPELLDLDVGDPADFAAAPTESCGGTMGPHDPNHCYWEQTLALFDLKVDDFPRVKVYREKVDIAVYWNAGVFSFRRSLGFIPTYIDTMDRLLTCGLSSPVSDMFYIDQHALSVVTQRLNMRLRHLPYTYNRTFLLPRAANHPTLWVEMDEQQRNEMTILHYHRSMGAFAELLEIVRECQPAAGEWLARVGPPRIRSDRWFKVRDKINRVLRERTFNKVKRAAQVVRNPNAGRES